MRNILFWSQNANRFELFLLLPLIPQRRISNKKLTAILFDEEKVANTICESVQDFYLLTQQESQKKALAKASAFFNEAHLRCMKNEAAFGYEAWLRHTERLVALRFMRASRAHRGSRWLLLHICEANASLTKL